MSDALEDAPLVEGAEADEIGMPPDPGPEAPYGVNPKTGKPFRRSPEDRARWGAAMAEARAAASGPGRRSASRRPVTPKPRNRPSAGPSAPKPAEIDPRWYSGATTGVRTAVMVLGLAGRFFPSMRYDALAVSLHGEALVDAAATAAEESAYLAGILESLAKVGPWDGLITVGLSIAMQVAANHNFVPPGYSGTLTKDALMRTVAPDAYRQMQEAAAAAASRFTQDPPSENGYSPN